jgi:signal transduction histidine kinase
LPATQYQAIQQIRQAANMLDDLVADINDSFRLQATSLPIHRATVDPDELLRGVAAEYRGLDRPVPDVQVMPGVGPVLADARLVGRVLHNLVGNAYKHGGAEARVALVAEPSPAPEGNTSTGVVRFAVDDDGCGIPESERLCVFERFIQGEGAARGSGLGLAFCKLVIEQLGGRIWADSSQFGGTRIAFELPCPRSQPTPQLVPGPSVSVAPSPGPSAVSGRDVSTGISAGASLPADPLGDSSAANVRATRVA